MATHSSILAWEIPWTEKPGRLQSRGLQRVRHDSATKQEQCLNGNRSNPFTEEREKREELWGDCRGLTGESVVASGRHCGKQNWAGHLRLQTWSAPSWSQNGEHHTALWVALSEKFSFTMGSGPSKVRTNRLNNDSSLTYCCKCTATVSGFESSAKMKPWEITKLRELSIFVLEQGREILWEKCLCRKA